MVRLGVAGLGRIAGAHLNAIESLSASNAVEGGCTLAAVATGKDPAAVDLPESVRIHRSYEELLQDKEVDAVIICYPNDMHRDAVMAAVAAGKHVLVEKPIGMNADEVSEMADAAEAAGVRLMSAQSRRFSDAIQEMKRGLPEIGRVHRLGINFLVPFDGPPTPWWSDSARAGDLILHVQGSHSVDTVVWLLDGEPSWIAARTARVNPRFGGSDEADILLGFDGDVSASVHLSLNTTPFVHEMIVVGERGSMRLSEYPTGEPFGFGFALDVNGETRRDGPQVPTLYTRQLSEFVTSIREEREPLASARELIRSTRVLDRVIEAARTGSVIR
jgi:predicted dehydrogenase